MKIFKLTKKKGIILGACLTLCLLVFAYTTSFGMQHYYKLDFSTGLVTASKLNVRSGPGTDYDIIGSVFKGEKLELYRIYGNWSDCYWGNSGGFVDLDYVAK